MAKNELLILTYDQEEYREKIAALNLPDVELLVPMSEEEIAEMVPRANICLGNPELMKNWLNQATKLQWMQSTFAGIDSMTSDSLRKDYALTNVKDVYGEVMAEYAFGYILMFEKEIRENVEHQKNKQWVRRLTPVLSTKTLGVLGTGSIGKDVARIGQAFKMNVLGYKNSPGEVEFFDDIYNGDSLHEMLAQCDYVISILPNTKHTNDLLGAAEFNAMKSSAVFMNLGRGNAVDEEVLVTAVQTGDIKGAVLDVFKEEPLPEDSALWSTEGVYITPHMSGNFVSDSLVEILAENYKRFQNDEELLHLVDLEKGY